MVYKPNTSTVKSALGWKDSVTGLDLQTGGEMSK